MKKNIIALIMGLFIMAGVSSMPFNPPVKAAFKASGNCDMCKERIEKALDVPGIKKAVYLPEVQKVEVIFNPSKLSLEQIQRLVSLAGHDTELFRAEEDAYQKLPACCRYREGTCDDHAGH